MAGGPDSGCSLGLHPTGDGGAVDHSAEGHKARDRLDAWWAVMFGRGVPLVVACIGFRRR